MLYLLCLDFSVVLGTESGSLSKCSIPELQSQPIWAGGQGAQSLRGLDALNDLTVWS